MGWNTLGDMIAARVGMGANCLNPDCLHYAELDLPALSARLGGETVTMGADTQFRRSLSCSRCGQRRIQLTIIAPGTRSATVRNK